MPRTVAFSLACLLVAAPQLAHAADPLCLPSVDPGPNWWTPSRKGPDWSGAVKRGVVTEQTRATLRSVWTPGRDVASFEVRVAHDPSIDPDHDAVIVMVSDASGTVPELYIRFSPLLDCVTPGSCTGAGAPLAADAIEYAEASMGISLSWSSVSPDNPDLDIVVTHPWVSLVPADGDHTWTLQFALSLPATGGAIDGDRQARDPTPTVIAELHNTHGGVLSLLGRDDEGAAAFLRSRAAWREAMGPDSLDESSPMMNLAELYGRGGRSAESCALYREALAIREAALPDGDARVQSARAGVALCNRAPRPR